MRKKPLIALGLILIFALPIVLLISLIILSELDLTSYKDAISKHVYQKTGRVLRLDGELRLKVSLFPTLVATDSSLSNSEWGSEPEMTKIEYLEARLALLPLFSKKIEITHIKLTGANILLETADTGFGNWERPKSKDVLENETAVSGNGYAFSIPPAFDIEISDSQLIYIRGSSQDKQILSIEHTIIKSDESSPQRHIDMKVNWNGNNFTVKGTVGGLLTAQQNKAAYPVDLTIYTLGISADVKGRLEYPFLDDMIHLAISARAQTLNQLASRFGAYIDPAFSPARLNLTVSGTPSKLKLSNIDATLGKTKIDGTLSLNTAHRSPLIRGNISLSNFTVANLLSDEIASEDRRDSQRLFSAKPITIMLPKQIRAKLQLKARNIDIAQHTLDNADADISLENNKLSVVISKAATDIGEFRGYVVLATHGGISDVQMALLSPQINLGKTLLHTQAAGHLEGNMAADIVLNGRGKSTADIMASLSGHIRLMMQDGRAKATSLDRTIGGLRTVFGTLFTKESNFTTIHCGICNLELKDGLAVTEVAVLDTSYSTVIIDGHINLAQEQLELRVTPGAKGVTLSLAVPIYIEGSIRGPSYTLDKTGTAFRVSELLGAIVYPPAALLVFSDFGKDKINPCVSLVSPTRDSLTKRTIRGLGSSTKKLIDGVQQGIKKTFKLEQAPDS